MNKRVSNETIYFHSGRFYLHNLSWFDKDALNFKKLQITVVYIQKNHKCGLTTKFNITFMPPVGQIIHVLLWLHKAVYHHNINPKIYAPALLLKKRRCILTCFVIALWLCLQGVYCKQIQLIIQSKIISIAEQLNSKPSFSVLTTTALCLTALWAGFRAWLRWHSFLCPIQTLPKLLCCDFTCNQTKTHPI